MKWKKSVSTIVIVALLVAILAPVVFVQNALAAPNLTQAYIRLDRMTQSTPTTGTICARPTTTATEGKVVVTFPTGYTVGLSANWTVDTTNTTWAGTPTPTAWPTIATGTASGSVVTFSGGDLTVGTTYCFNWTSTAALTTATAGVNQIGSIETQTGASATIDKSSVALATVTSDQISVTGYVNPTFSFALPTNTDTFTTALTNGATSTTSGSTATVITNARNGWTAWVKSANAGLASASPGATTIATVGTYPTITTLSSGTTGYLLKVATTNGSGGAASPAPGYTTSGTDDGGALSTTYRVAAAGTSSTAGDTATFTERARVSATQPPASDYTDTLTVVAAGLF